MSKHTINPGDVVAGVSNRRGVGEVIVRVIAVHREGGVLAVDDRDRLHGWNPDDAAALAVIERVGGVPTITSEHGSVYLDDGPHWIGCGQ